MRQSREMRRTRALTPREREVDGIVDHLVVDVAAVPRVDRPIRPPAEVALAYGCAALPPLDYYALGMVGEGAQLQASVVAGGRVEAGERALRLGPEGILGLDEPERREVAILGVSEVEVVATEVLPKCLISGEVGNMQGVSMLTARGRTRMPQGRRPPTEGTSR